MQIKFYFFSLSLLFITALSFAQPPAGYYDEANGKTGVVLQSTLHNIIKDHTVVDYSSIWAAFQTTDRKADGKIWDMYSDIPGGTPAYTFTYSTMQCGNYSREGDCYNREHSFPKSWFNDVLPMNCDLFHIYATDGYVNSKRDNYPFGETQNPVWTSTNGSKLGVCSFPGYTKTVFEPIDEYKGDFARTYFYMATRYYGEDAAWPGSDMVNGAQPKPWALEMLLQWCAKDPVSDKEINRNNAIFALQHNRNPFIDHPEYVSLVWQNGLNEPSNQVNNFSSSFIQLSWDDAVGSSLPSGYLILYNTTGFNSIQTPVDGIAPENYDSAKIIKLGVKSCTLGNLMSNTRYYFKIFSFKGTGATTDYKTDGAVPQLEAISN